MSGAPTRARARAVGAAAALWLLGVAAHSGAAPAVQAPTVQAPTVSPPSVQARPYAAVSADQPLRWPADRGSHPDFRTEWWYVTGWLSTADGQPLGFQITFFRTRPRLAEDNPSAFAPRQILIAHCALSDPRRGRLWQDQRVRRAGLGLAQAREGDTDVWMGAWSLRHAGGGYAANLQADGFGLTLQLAETQPPLLHGVAGISRKGAAADAASYYYSQPHLRVSGRIARGARSDAVTGEAWLDHEWSSEYLDAGAVGWDWVGLNLDDGAAVMAFRMRGAQGETRWAGGTLRDADGRVHTLAPQDIVFTARRSWRSPRTGIVYPVEWSVRTGARSFLLRPLLDDQENDTRQSTGALYWEGAVRAVENGQVAGRGYLELTGYAEPLRLP